MKTIQLTKGKHALVNDEDFEMLNQYKWHARQSAGKFYASRREKEGRSMIHMHRQVMRTPVGKETDHIDGDSLNNQRSNLRICTRAENMCNRDKQSNNKSGLKGVSLNKNTGKWRAVIQNDGRQVHLGLFTSKLAAHEAYTEACIKYHGNFARV